MSIVRSIIFVLIMLGVLATLHELGHFWVARLLKIKVYEVSIFVGPRLISWQHKDVKFSIRRSMKRDMLSRAMIRIF